MACRSSSRAVSAGQPPSKLGSEDTAPTGRDQNGARCSSPSRLVSSQLAWRHPTGARRGERERDGHPCFLPRVRGANPASAALSAVACWRLVRVRGAWVCAASGCVGAGAAAKGPDHHGAEQDRAGW